MKHKSAVLRVLFEQWPAGPGEWFVQAREWETVDGEHADILLELGMVDAAGDLDTEIRVLPLGDDLAVELERLRLPAAVDANGRPIVVAAD